MTTKKASEVSPLKQVMGPLWKLFSSSECDEILIDSYDGVYSSCRGKITHEKVFKASKDLDLLISRLLKFSKKKIIKDEMAYFFHLDEFTRVNIVLPPLADNGPRLSVGKLPNQEVTLVGLI